MNACYSSGRLAQSAARATFGCSDSRHLLLAVAACCLSLSWALPVYALPKAWANAVTGSWSTAGNWSPSGVPAATDSAVFNKAGTYTVNFPGVFQDLSDMSFSAGTVTFERTANPATLTILNASGGQTLTVGGATLNMGNTLPVNITTGIDANINSGGTLNVNVGSVLNTGFDVHVNSGGTLTVNSNADIISKFGFIGSAGGSTGTATVTGVGSAWTTNGGSIIAGSTGNGALTIQSGGSVVGFNDVIGNSAGTTGTATVTGAGSTWNSSGSLTVGASGAGTLRIENGATVTSGSVVIGKLAAATGAATVTGSGSKWNSSGSLSVGFSGTGALTIADSGTVNVGSGAGQVTIDSASTLNIGAGGAAGVLQAGALVNNGVLQFDHTDATTFSTPISGGGQIVKVGGSGTTTFTNVSAYTGSYAVVSGLAILQGDANGDTYLVGVDGSGGNGTLRFSDAAVSLGSHSIQAAAGGAVEYDNALIQGGFLRGPGTHTIIPGASETDFNSVTTFNSTNVVQNGSAYLSNFTNGGTFTNSAALTFDGGVNAATGVINVNSALATYDVGNSGVITVNNGGAINNQLGNFVSGGGSRTTINSGGAINLLVGTTLELNGALLVNNGTVTGTVNVNYGSLAKGTGNYGVVNVNQGGVYSPGNSPGISTAAAVSFQTGLFTSGAPRLIMELGGTTPGTQYDQLHVAGALALNGILDVELVDLGSGVFVPSAGDSFDLLDWGSLSGTFSTIQLPALAGGLAWNTSQLYTSGVLCVVSAGLFGDYNGNGIVDAADYTIWRDHLSQTFALPNRSPGNTGPISTADYAFWTSQFGNHAGGGIGAAAAVPEPASVWMLLMGMLGMRTFRRVFVS